MFLCDKQFYGIAFKVYKALYILQNFEKGNQKNKTVLNKYSFVQQGVFGTNFTDL